MEKINDESFEKVAGGLRKDSTHEKMAKAAENEVVNKYSGKSAQLDAQYADLCRQRDMYQLAKDVKDRAVNR